MVVLLGSAELYDAYESYRMQRQSIYELTRTIGKLEKIPRQE